MKLQLLGCNHRDGSAMLRERLTIPASRLASTLSDFGNRFPSAEAVVLSTCNRIEIYTATSGQAVPPSHQDVAAFLAEVQGLDPNEVFDKVFQRNGQEAVEHLFAVAASLDSMVIGETQILSQVKQAYELATHHNTTGQFTHAAFQRAMYVAKRVSNETGLHRNRVSIPSVAIRDFAKQIFERFDGKSILMVGAGEMAKESLRCLVEDGADTMTVINRSHPRADQLACQFGATAGEWNRLPDYLARADLIICATGSDDFVISQSMFDQAAPQRHQRPLFILDLAIPRNVEASIGEEIGVYLYGVDDLAEACEANQQRRARELPKVLEIVQEESSRFMGDIESRATGPIIRRLKEQADDIRDAELARLVAKLDDLNADYHSEIENSFRRLVNKLLHPPLESLREDSSQSAPPANLVDALKRLFKLRE